MQKNNESLVTKQSVIDTFLYCVTWQNENGESESIENKRAFLEKVMDIVPPAAYKNIGHWEDCSNGSMCSICKTDVSKETNYCPNCGAEMIRIWNE